MRRVVVWITVAYLLGVVAASYVCIDQLCLLFAVIASLLVTLVGSCYSCGLMRCGVVCLLVLLGWFNGTATSMSSDCPDITEYAGGAPIEFEGIVWEEPYADQGRTIPLLRVTSVLEHERVVHVDGYVRVTISQGCRLDDEPEFGDVIRIIAPIRLPDEAANPGQFDWRSFLNSKGIGATANVRPWNSISVVGKARMPFLMLLRVGLLQRVRHVIVSHVPSPYHAILLALVTGDKTELPLELSQRFQDVGVFHVLAVSGLHVGFVGFMLFSLVAQIGIHRRYAAMTALIGVGLYAFTVGLRPSVTRASIMAMTLFIGVVIEREQDGVSSLALAALLTCLASPGSLFDIGFQLSYLAVLGIMKISPIVATYLSFLPTWLCTPLTVSIGATVSTLPLTALYFGYVCSIGPISNLVCIPIAALSVKLGLVLTVAGIVVPFLGRPIGIAVTLALKILVSCVNVLSSIPFAVIYVGTPSAWFLVVYYLTILWMVLPSKLNPFIDSVKYHRRKSIIACLFMLATLIWCQVSITCSRHSEIVFLDVGFGDAIFLQTRSGHTILIDGGSGDPEMIGAFDCGERIVVPFLRHRGIRRIDVVVLSHPHEDHCGGLIAVIESIDVGLVCDVGVAHPSRTYDGFLNLVSDSGIPYVQLSKGMSIYLGQDAVIQVLHPVLEGNTYADNINNSSAVLKASFESLCVLFTGDIEQEIEELLVRNSVDLRSHVLKVPHHGSDTSSTTAFLEAVAPEIAVISVGPNTFGAPSHNVVSRLKQENVRVYRTDEQGAITIVVDGERPVIRTVKRFEPK